MTPEKREKARAEFLKTLDPELGYDETTAALLGSGLWTAEELAASKAQQNARDLAIKEGLMEIQHEHNAASAEAQVERDLYADRYEFKYTKEGLANTEALARAAHQGAEDAVTLEDGGSIFSKDDEFKIGDDVRSALVESGGGKDHIVSEADNNIINAGRGDDYIEVTSNVQFSHGNTHILDGGEGIDHYTINVKGVESAIYDKETDTAHMGGVRDETIIKSFEEGESITLSFDAGALRFEGLDDARELLAAANVQMEAGLDSFLDGTEVESQALPDGRTSVTITR